MNSARKKEILRVLNRNSWDLPDHLLRKTLPCDGCKQLPIINPEWLGNSRYTAFRRFKLGCPSGMWGLAEAWETLEEAIINWNDHVTSGGHYCGQ